MSGVLWTAQCQRGDVRRVKVQLHRERWGRSLRRTSLEGVEFRGIECADLGLGIGEQASGVEVNGWC